MTLPLRPGQLAKALTVPAAAGVHPAGDDDGSESESDDGGL